MSLTLNFDASDDDHSVSDDDGEVDADASGEVDADDDDGDDDVSSLSEDGANGNNDGTEMCPRFFVSLRDSAVVNMKRIVQSNAAKYDGGSASSSPASDNDGDTARRRRRRTKDVYDTNDPFVDDADIGDADAELVAPLFDGFFAQTGNVKTKRTDALTETAETDAFDTAAKQSPSLSLLFDTIVAASASTGGSNSFAVRHRLPAPVIPLLGQLHDAIHAHAQQHSANATQRNLILRHASIKLHAVLLVNTDTIRKTMTREAKTSAPPPEPPTPVVEEPTQKRMRRPTAKVLESASESPRKKAKTPQNGHANAAPTTSAAATSAPIMSNTFVAPPIESERWTDKFFTHK